MSTETTDDRVVLEIADGIAEIRLVSPERGNAIDPRWGLALGAAIDGVAAARAAPGGEEAVRVVLLTAEGRSFTVGGDIGYFQSQEDRLGEAMHDLVSGYDAMLLRLAELPLPVVAAVQGAIAGGGIGLALVADIVLCTPEAKFATAFHGIGLSGDGGCSWFLPRYVGLRRAQEMMIGGRVISGTEAHEWGLVSAVVPAGELARRARERALALASGPTAALGRTRALLLQSAEVPLAEHHRREAEGMAATAVTADGREGIAAFAERRPPVFRGR